MKDNVSKQKNKCTINIVNNDVSSCWIVMSKLSTAILQTMSLWRLTQCDTLAAKHNMKKRDYKHFIHYRNHLIHIYHAKHTYVHWITILKEKCISAAALTYNLSSFMLVYTHDGNTAVVLILRDSIGKRQNWLLV